MTSAGIVVVTIPSIYLLSLSLAKGKLFPRTVHYIDCFLFVVMSEILSCI